MSKGPKNILLLIISCAGIMAGVFAQNMVSNNGFDAISPCPCSTCTGDIVNASPWAAPTPATRGDLFNTCVSSAPMLEGVPANGFGNQSPRSSNGYAGVSCYNSSGTYREYLMIQLSSALVAGSQYVVSFYVSLADNYQFAIKEVGAYFTPSVPVPGFGGLVTPSGTYSLVENSTFLSDKTGWTLVTGTFTAAGGETYLLIGNFRTDATTSWTNVGSGSSLYAYYYVEDVSVTPAALPLQLLAFTAASAGTGSVNLSWETASAGNISHFTVERRQGDKGDFLEIGIVGASGSSYSYTDVPAGRDNYYRLRMAYPDGSGTYSYVIHAGTGGKPALEMGTVSAGGDGILHAELSVPAGAEWPDYRVLDVLGRTLLAGRVQAEGRQVLSLDVSSLSDGFYYLLLSDGSGMQARKWTRW